MKNKMVKTEKVYKRYPRRKLDPHSITTPDASLSIRVVLDRAAKGLPVNAKLSKHVPLPPDGDLLTDFETGTEEILDVCDAVAHVDELKAQQRYIEEQKEKARQEALGAIEPKPVTIESSEAPK